MDMAHFKPSSDFMGEAERLFAEHKAKFALLIPAGDTQHIGGTAIPGLLTKGDLDINIRVNKENFSAAVKILKKLYKINQRENWNENFASFKDDDSCKLPLGIQVTVIGSSDDCFIKQRDILLSHPGLVKEFNESKTHL